LLGHDKSLVLHGGGNTSVKIGENNLFGEKAGKVRALAASSAND
jgi:rhamnose utilization protein RhaD (predicted bifunctional aldolase and dehydrogenase)